MLNNTLNTNEIKDSAGTEVEFTRLSTDGRKTEFAKVSESPAEPHRLTIQHSESGTGLNRRRRSVVRFDLTAVSDVDTTKYVKHSAYVVLDAPVGAVTSQAKMADVLANIQSFLSTTGAGTTVLFNGTGSGATALLQGSL